MVLNRKNVVQKTSNTTVNRSHMIWLTFSKVGNMVVCMTLGIRVV